MEALDWKKKIIIIIIIICRVSGFWNLRWYVGVTISKKEKKMKKKKRRTNMRLLSK